MLALLAAALIVLVSITAALGGRGSDSHHPRAAPGTPTPPHRATTSASLSAPTSAGATPSPARSTSTPGTVDYGVDPSTASGSTDVNPLNTGSPNGAGTTAQPLHLSIHAIGVNASLESLNLAANGTLEGPREWQDAGWYVDSARPGDPGPTVIAGHVDSVSGPAVFYRLRDLRAGDQVHVRGGDGRSVTYIVDTVASYPKNDFPSTLVYGPSALPVLRLITCTGDFDYATHNYLDNLVVSGHIA